MTFKPHISKGKKDEVAEIKKLFQEYKVAGVVNLEGLPTLMLQRIKFSLGESICLKPTKKRLIKIAFDEMKDLKNIDQLKEKLIGIPALLFTNEDPFILYKKLEKSKASAAAKPGQTAPNDLGVEAGETPFAPGPMIGELGMLGLKTEVKNGKIHIKDEKILVKEGEEISEQVAGLLAKMGVEPMKVGLNLILTYENGEILDKSVLSVDEEEYINNIKAAHAESFALAMHLGVLNSETVKPLIAKAHNESLALADSANIVTSGNVGKILAKAEAEASSLNSKIPEAPKEEPKPEPVKEEPKPVAEVKEEAPVETPKEEPTPEHVKEAPKEEPATEPVVEVKEEAPVETPKEESVEEQTEKEEKKPAEEPEKAPEEQPKEIKKDMQEITNIANKILGTGLKGDSITQTEPKPENQDINKIINTLKDKKSQGDT
ncbi:50S ribosomal protein L10 [Candidatus Woesearchaeota archaeon]|jgi:large subunit ribosomal protein L10|nr:50S ribosomal protein L10 [Candidatus Woesearchaeota archaeon]MBT6044881.1 50S ribosomal protein L10 [Candidatus Woesearchaeota archaeon]